MASDFRILPAIDLRGGRVVRLRQGDFRRETAYSDDPVAVARSFADAGARWLHVVDLDGARTGEPAHAAVVAALVRAVGGAVAVELAGGLRSDDAVTAALAAGAARVVVGTAALRDPAFAGRIVGTHGAERIAVALDVLDGLALGEAWHGGTGTGGVPAADLLAALADEGVTTFEATAIDRDGLMGGPDLELLGRLVRLSRGEIIASGGIRSAADIDAVRDLGCTGAIVGRSIYEGHLDLRAAIAATR